MFLAHIRYDDGVRVEQSLQVHCQETAQYTAERLAPIGLYHVGYLAGWLHDMGKAKLEFQEYLEKATRGEKVNEGSVVHSTMGLVWLWERYHTKEASEYELLTCELIGYSVGAHHGNFDLVNEDGDNGIKRKLDSTTLDEESGKRGLHYDETVQNFFSFCLSIEEAEQCFSKAVKEVTTYIKKIACESIFHTMQDTNFAIGLLERIILSALIEGDRRSTIEFNKNVTFPGMKKEELSAIWKRQLTYLEGRRFEPSKLNDVRKRISDACKEFAEEHQSGIYRLSVPTGSGKTISTLRLALAHCVKYQKERIFFIIPLLSVIEQNAKEIRKHIEDESILLEHHSNVIHTNESEQIDEHEMLTDNWESMIVISTLYQLLNTLFNGKTSSIRRMHSLCNSVIVIDEVQSIPYKMMSIFNNAMNFLAYYCNATIILCSATQPCSNEVKHPIHLGKPMDIVPYEQELWGQFKRTEIVNMTLPPHQDMTISELAEFSTQIMSKSDSLLLICNTRSEARELYERILLQNHVPEKPFSVSHLSTSMCMKNREDTMDEVKAYLNRKERIVVVATQLVEAGVDFSFENVIRISAGLDNIVQAAGRCNRNGEFSQLCKVYVVNLKKEMLRNLQEIQLNQLSLIHFFWLYEKDKGKYDDDVFSDKSIRQYYKELFQEAEVKMKFDYPVPKLNTSLYDMLSENSSFTNNANEVCTKYLRQAFKTAGREFHVFDEATEDYIVAYNNEAKELIADLNSGRAQRDFQFAKDTLQKLQKYSISLYDYQIKELENCKAINIGKQIPYREILNPEVYYNVHTGFNIEVKTSY